MGLLDGIGGLFGSTSPAQSWQGTIPWGRTRPAVGRGFDKALNWFENDWSKLRQDPYGGQMVAGMTPMQLQALGQAPGATQAALGGVNQAMGAAGRAMDPNAHSDMWGQVKENVIDSIMPAINSSFAGSGMTGSGLHAQNLTAGLSQGLADVENQAWQQNQNRSLAAAGMVPGLNNARFGALDYLGGAGQQMQDQRQRQINADITRHAGREAGDFDALERYMRLVGGAASPWSWQEGVSSGGNQKPGLFGMLSGAATGAGFLGDLFG